MDNPQILRLLTNQRDNLYEKLQATSISGLHYELYNDIRAGNVFFVDGGEREALSELKELSKDTSHDGAFYGKLAEYLSLDNEDLIEHFQTELQRILKEIVSSGKQDEIQALFIEYDYYYHYTSCVGCCGKQEYPIIEEPRYITKEYDYNNQILFLTNGINFQPAWVNCEEFSDIEYLDVDLQLEELFKLHSRTLLHEALDNLRTSGKLDFLHNRPLSFYINEHDCEVMMLYRLN